MRLELFVTRRATREIERIARWWSQNRSSAPGAVRDDLRAVFELLRHEPGVGALVPDAKSLNVRRIHLDRIRYWIYYRVRASRIEVLAVWHSSRGEPPSV